VGWEVFDIGRAEPLLQMGTRLIGAAVRERRVRLNLTQRQLAMIAGFDQSVISRLENGKISSIRYRRLAVLVGILGGLDADAPLPRWKTMIPPRDLVRAVHMDAWEWAGLPYGIVSEELKRVILDRWEREDAEFERELERERSASGLDPPAPGHVPPASVK